jgi:transcriptional regulator with PAS, ATPase and Fis domain
VHHQDGTVRWKTPTLPESGASIRYQLLVFTGESTRTFDLPAEGKVTIGRGPAMVKIDNPSVSRNHAVLHVGDQLIIEDLGSANGTLVRDRRSAAAGEDGGRTLDMRQIRGCSAELAVGDSLLFGTASVIIRHVPTIEVPDLAGDVHAPNVIVRDAGMRALHAHAALAARSLINVLILGETGVGKEVLARAIHAHSRRARGPFIAVNCAAFTESLQESELFGYDKGAFTGATGARPGVFEAAEGGTLFLDEVGELAPSTQAKLLRVLAERQVVRLGSTTTRAIDVRVVSATNRDVEGDASTGSFRRDLYYRLNGISLLIPPLRQRPGEIEPLARMFLEEAAREIERGEPPRLSAEALDVLRRHAWLGNVRELRNAMERAVALCEGNTIWPEDLPPSIHVEHAEVGVGVGVDKRTDVGEPQPRRAAALSPTETEERDRIVAALDSHAGNQTRAALALGMSRRTLITRIEQYGIPRPRKPEGAAI